MSEHLFLFPHPDDEFAVSLILRDLRTAAQKTRCVYLTGCGSDGQSAGRRERETLRALNSLGVPTDSVDFLGQAAGFRDGSLHTQLEQAYQRLKATIVASDSLRIYVPAWEGGHQDHDAAHLIGLALASAFDTVTVRQFSLYHGAGLPGPFFRVMSPLDANGVTEDRTTNAIERLQQVLFCMRYPSQWKTWIGLLPLIVMRMLTDGRFRLQPVDVARVLGPPHAGIPLYARRGFLDETDFRLFADPFIASHLGCKRQRSSAT